MAYIWNTLGKYPDEIYNKPPLVKEFIYQATMQRIKAEQKAMKNTKGG